MPLYTPRWGAQRAWWRCVPHLFGAHGIPGACGAAGRRRVARRAAAGARLPPRAVRGDQREHGGRPRRTGESPRCTVEVIYPGIDTRGVHAGRRGARAAMPMFAYLGRLKKYKGVHLVIRAFAAMQHRNAVLEIAGAGDYRARLERLAASLDLGARVRFLGRISDDGEAGAAAPRRGRSPSRRRRKGGGSRIWRPRRAPRPWSRRTRRAFANRCATARPGFSCRTVTSKPWRPRCDRLAASTRCSSSRWGCRRDALPKPSRGSGLPTRPSST